MEWKGEKSKKGTFESKFWPQPFFPYLYVLSMGYVSGFHYLNGEFVQIYMYPSSLSLKLSPRIVICLSVSLHFPVRMHHCPVSQTQHV